MAPKNYPFKRTNKTIYKKPSSIVTEDALYWKKLGSPVLVKEFGAIDYLDFCPVEPYYFAATCSVRVQIYDPITKVVAKNISKFVEAAYGGSFRADGRLLVAGSEESAVKLFDVQSKSILRVFTGHSGPVHRTFFTKDHVKILSFSDDKSVSVWDIATEERIANFSEHSDYVRSGAPSPISPDIILSGGYDHMVKLYDCRSNETVLSVDHGSPVESTLFLPSGGIFISAGGTEIKVWDIFNGGKLLANISQHHKTVTTLRLASNNSRLMSASLDRHVKVYDTATFKVVHNIDFPNAVMSMAVSENDDILAVGMIDGVISIRKRDQPAQISEEKALLKFAPDHVDTVVVSNDVSEKEAHFDKHLRKNEYSKALATVLKSFVTAKHPEKTVALLQELLRRNVLHIAVSNLDEKGVGGLLRFVTKHLGESRFTRTIIDTMNVFTDVYETRIKNFSEYTLSVYSKVQKQINEEIEVCKRVCELEGALSLLLAGAQISSKDAPEITTILEPSTRAQKDIVIDV
ncbi:unnamed protein product [Plutella xylostella]|uniref:U3 small nucleolar RNA-associated protein 15 homolog n=1 Tax=Plutella xylostella TaxID=51655 RepID=A0A8S4EM88_PLUXY|nr:U3 small nucleolar RNA-associated protein 15 homolog [Plutella xylostella]CAG9116738.1 unnamed protein product [Plutella xylostella]